MTLKVQLSIYWQPILCMVLLMTFYHSDEHHSNSWKDDVRKSWDSYAERAEQLDGEERVRSHGSTLPKKSEPWGGGGGG